MICDEWPILKQNNFDDSTRFPGQSPLNPGIGPAGINTLAPYELAAVADGFDRMNGSVNYGIKGIIVVTTNGIPLRRV